MSTFTFTVEPRGSRWLGFTLVELLVVIAIIALLAAILFPVFGRARENARRSACQSNLKQVGLGIIQYAQDFDERLPPHTDTGAGVVNFMNNGVATNYLALIYPYTKSIQIYRCPSAPASTTSGVVPDDNNDTNYFGNAVVFQPTGKSIAAFEFTAGYVAVQEFFERRNTAYLRPKRIGTTSNFEFWHAYNTTTQRDSYSSIHFDGGNLLFVDGHVKFRPYRSLDSNIFGLRPDQNWTTTNGQNPDGGGNYTMTSGAGGS